MKFNYKTNFKLDIYRQKFINKTIKNGKFYINKDNIILSKEYPENEIKNLNSDSYSKKKFKDKKRKYYIIIEKLCKQYYPNSINVIEVGAGTGRFAKMYISKFKPKNYILYDSSKLMIRRIKKKLKTQNFTKIIIKNKSFKNISELNKYDCVIALEALEHINWDKEFLSSISHGTWVFFSVPRVHAFNHVRAFLTPDSITYRYKDILNIYEIREVRRNINFKSKHNYPIHWAIVSQKK